MFGVPFRYELAVLLAVLGLFLIGCGTTVCWRRWLRRGPGCPPPEKR